MSILTLIPLLPLTACVLLTVAGRRLGPSSHRVAIPAVAMSFGLSVVAAVQVWSAGPQSIDLYRFVQVDTLVVDLGFYVDQLTVLLLLLVTSVSAIVHVYSSRYMIGDPRYARFFAVIGLFTAAMIALVMSRNLLMTFMCWEVMGICSYLLISHWAHRPAAGAAATKAFLVNAVADVGLLCAVLLAAQTFGTLDIPTILERASEVSGATVRPLGWAGVEWSVPSISAVASLLFVGALGKSAQLPFHVWLPFAMEAPTPVSALIHAATMVNAGPFLLVRFSPLLMLAPGVMAVIAVVGAATALFAAIVSTTQSDIKKILAYSTISQIGFMVMMCGAGAFVAAVFHLLAHGFLKAFLFLSTGNALQALTPHAPHDREPAPGQRSLSWPAAVGALVFACVPPAILFSGPYETMWTLHRTPGATVAFWFIALATVFLTGVYTSRAVVTHFREGFVLSGEVVRPQFFSIPHSFIVAAGALVLMGFFLEFPAWFTAFLAPALAPIDGFPPGLAAPARFQGWQLVPLLAAVGGWAVGVFRPLRPMPVVSPGWTNRLYVLFWNKWYVDEIYDAYIVAPNLRLARSLANRVERTLVDGAIDALVASSVHTALWLWQVLEGRGLDRAVGSTATASVGTARWLWRVLEGRGLQGGTERLSRQADSVGQFFQRREVHTLQEHLLLVISGLALLLMLFYLGVRGE